MSAPHGAAPTPGAAPPDTGSAALVSIFEYQSNLRKEFNINITQFSHSWMRLYVVRELHLLPIDGWRDGTVRANNMSV